MFAERSSFLGRGRNYIILLGAACFVIVIQTVWVVMLLSGDRSSSLVISNDPIEDVQANCTSEYFFDDVCRKLEPLPLLERLWGRENGALLPVARRGYTLWGTDCHMGPRREFADVLSQLGHKYTDMSLQEHRDDMKGLTWKNMVRSYSTSGIEAVRREFFEGHKNDPQVRDADAFVCSFDPYYCLVYLPWNKPIFVMSAFRFEGHIKSNDDLTTMNAELRQMAAHPDVILAGLDWYDAAYLNHFTGSLRIAAVPATGNYVKKLPHGAGDLVYKGEKLPLIFIRWTHRAQAVLTEMIRTETKKYGYGETLNTVGEIYGHNFALKDILAHQALIVLPYSIYSHSMVELRYANVPMIFPSRKLLAKWHKSYNLVAERDSDLSQTSGEAMLPFTSPRSLSGKFNPNDDKTLEDIEYWLQFADFYKWAEESHGGVVTFDSFKELATILMTTDFAAVNERLKSYNKKLREEVLKRWENILAWGFHGRPLPGESGSLVPATYEEGMALWRERSSRPNWEEMIKKAPPEPTSKDGKPDKWIVITTINHPTSQLKRMAALKDWHLLVVADHATPSNWSLDGAELLTVGAQRNLSYRTASLLPWNSYARKNIGYLYAIENGAQIIYETDDDNVPSTKNAAPVVLPETAMEAEVYDKEVIGDVVNPYSHFGKPTVWPRGFPLELVRDPCPSKDATKKQASVWMPVQQGLADLDPDVDAIFRLTRRLGIFFNKKSGAVALPDGMLAPYNTQNTIVYKSCFWALLLPHTTSFRLVDIWRGYFAQRLMWEVGARLAFLPPTAIQERNAHNYIADMVQEEDMMRSAGRIVRWLRDWTPPPEQEHLFGIATILAEEMASAGFWGKADAELAKAWFEDLVAIGYKPPALRKK